MSTLLSAQSVGYDNAFGVLLSEISFSLKKGDRIGLIGDNGCGKSTLLQLLSGDLPTHAGTVTLSHQCQMARIEQHLPPELHANTLLDAVLAQLPAGQHLSERWRCEALLAELGFEPGSWTLTAGTLSGGQHTRLLLARALIRQPDLLLLDEPSNHLDMAGKEELAETLRQFAGAVILVTHDRMLIEQSCNRFWLIDQQKLEEWHDLAPVYQRLGGETPALPTADKADTNGPTPDERLEGEEALLTALFALESKLEDDLARKPKHQKPALQARWRREIADITARLNLG
ncbi:putative transporter ATP-binding component [Klebsiella oxytoca]|nr:putative transporter ATP-binding component [Klebsiella oxytoca]